MESVEEEAVLLVVECQSSLDWGRVFEGARLADGTAVRVVQAAWDDISLVSWPSQVRVQVRGAAGGSFAVDHVLIRSVSRGTWTQDSSNKLLALCHSAVPCTNTASSCCAFLEKALVYGELRKIQQRLGKEAFPLIEQTMYPSYREMSVCTDLPCVGKTGSAHAGKGKILIRTAETWEDYASLVAIQPFFCTAEKYIDWEYDGRVQKIGQNYRVFHRRTTTWKGNSGRGAILEEKEVTPQMKLWADECSKLFGGIDILGLDFVCEKETGKLIILELNDTAIGLVHKNEYEDMGHMRDIVMAKMNLQRRKSNDKDVSHDAEKAALAIASLQEQVRRLILEKKELVEKLKTL